MRIQSEKDMILALREMWPQPEFVLIPQVRDAVGYAGNRTADALVMGVWKSRGIYLHGIEIKVSRADWLAEKRNPKKAESIGKYCDFWWLAIASEEIVKDGELPAAWGLIVGDKDGSIKKVKQPEKLPTEPMSRLFLAEILRKAVASSGLFADIDMEIDARVKAAVEKQKEAIRKTAESDVHFRLKRAEELRAAVEAFENASGIKIDRYSDYFSREIGSAVAAIRQAGLDLTVKRKFAEVERVLARVLEDTRAHREALEKVWPSEVEAAQ